MNALAKSLSKRAQKRQEVTQRDSLRRGAASEEFDIVSLRTNALKIDLSESENFP